MRKGVLKFLSVCAIVLSVTVLSVPIAGLMGVLSSVQAVDETELRIGFMQKVDSLNPYVGLNDAAKPLCLAIPPREAARLALRLANEADAKVAALSDSMLAKIRAAGSPFNLSRASHRAEHLDDIERALSA